MFAFLSESASPDAPLCPEGMANFRATFKTLLTHMNMGHLPYKPYSLRRGGATHDFITNNSYHTLMSKGRWMNLRAAKIYVDEARLLLSNRSFNPALDKALTKQAQRFDALFYNG